MGKRGPVAGHHSLVARDPEHEMQYRLGCTCGWAGEWRRRKHDADDDFINHLAPVREEIEIRKNLILLAKARRRQEREDKAAAKAAAMAAHPAGKGIR